MLHSRIVNDRPQKLLTSAGARRNLSGLSLDTIRANTSFFRPFRKTWWLARDCKIDVTEY